MKSIIALFLIVNSGLILATETCYTSTTKTPSDLPQSFCLESASLSVNSGDLYTDGKDTNLPKVLKNTTLIRNTEDSYKFTAKKTIIDFLETTCGESILAELEISGSSDVYGAVEADALNISVNYETQNDSCHSMPVSETYIYKLVK